MSHKEALNSSTNMDFRKTDYLGLYHYKFISAYFGITRMRSGLARFCCEEGSSAQLSAQTNGGVSAFPLLQDNSHQQSVQYLSPKCKIPTQFKNYFRIIVLMGKKQDEPPPLNSLDNSSPLATIPKKSHRKPGNLFPSPHFSTFSSVSHFQSNKPF